MKRYGFLFGAGAEFAYNLPSGGQFALDIFRQDPAEPKQKFREMRDKVDSTTSYGHSLDATAQIKMCYTNVMKKEE